MFVTDKNSTVICVMEIKQNSEEKKEINSEKGKRERKRQGRKRTAIFLGFDSK